MNTGRLVLRKRSIDPDKRVRAYKSKCITDMLTVLHSFIHSRCVLTGFSTEIKTIINGFRLIRPRRISARIGDTTFKKREKKSNGKSRGEKGERERERKKKGKESVAERFLARTNDVAFCSLESRPRRTKWHSGGSAPADNR